MGAYENMLFKFSQTLSNEDAGIREDDEPTHKRIKLLYKEKNTT